MDDLVKPHAPEQLIERRTIRQIAMHELERLGQRLDVAQVALLELRVVKRVQIVKRPDGVSPPKQPLANMRPDETRPASDQKIHAPSQHENDASVKLQETSVSLLPTAPGGELDQTNLLLGMGGEQLVNNFILKSRGRWVYIVSGEASTSGPRAGMEIFVPGRQDEPSGRNPACGSAHLI